jgi:hypothetical protein
MTNQTIINTVTMRNFQIISYRFNVLIICASIISFSNNKTYHNTNIMMTTTTTVMMMMMTIIIIIIMYSHTGHCGK